MIEAHSPPRLPRAMLRHAVPDEARDGIDGDLHELYVAGPARRDLRVQPTEALRAE
jgi:hypothetical protein